MCLFSVLYILIQQSAKRCSVLFFYCWIIYIIQFFCSNKNQQMTTQVKKLIRDEPQLQKKNAGSSWKDFLFLLQQTLNLNMLLKTQCGYILFNFL